MSAMNKIVRIFKHKATFKVHIVVVSLRSCFVDHVSWSHTTIFATPFLFLGMSVRFLGLFFRPKSLTTISTVLISAFRMLHVLHVVN